MHLVDNKDRVTALLRNDAHLLDEVADVIYRVVRRCIQLVNIKRAALVERTARLTLVTRLAIAGILAVDSLREDAGTRCFTYTAGAAEEVGVGKLSALYGILQCRSDMSLPDNRCEGCWAILAC